MKKNEDNKTNNTKLIYQNIELEKSDIIPL